MSNYSTPHFSLVDYDDDDLSVDLAPPMPATSVLHTVAAEQGHGTGSAAETDDMMGARGESLAESATHTPRVCAMCAVKVAKYTCAACGRRTCSLACVNAHKSEYECAGTRGIGKWSDFRAAGGDGTAMQSLLKEDYTFLEDVCRVAGAAKRIIHGYGTTAAPEGAKPRNKRSRSEMTPDVDIEAEQRLPHRLNVLRQQANRMGIDLRFMPSGMQRHDCNTTAWLSSKPKAKKKHNKKNLKTPGKTGADEGMAPTETLDGSLPLDATTDSSKGEAEGMGGHIDWRVELEFPAGEPPCRFTEAAINDQTPCTSILSRYLGRVMESSALLNAAVRQQLVRYKTRQPASTAPQQHAQGHLGGSNSTRAAAAQQPEGESESAGGYDVVVLYRHPFAVHGIQAYLRVPDLTASMRDILTGKVVVEYPTFVVLPAGFPSLSEAYPTMESIEARFPAATAKPAAASSSTTIGSAPTAAPAAKKAAAHLSYATPTPWSSAALSSLPPPVASSPSSPHAAVPAVHPDALLRALQADGILSSRAPGP